MLTGRVVESAAASDRFLWDFRKTIGEMMAENHYDQLNQLLQRARHGPLRRIARIGPGVYRRRHGGQTQRRYAHERHVDTAARVNAEQYGYNADIRESASVAHIYGQNLVAAESLTP